LRRVADAVDRLISRGIKPPSRGKMRHKLTSIVPRSTPVTVSRQPIAVSDELDIAGACAA